MNFNFGKNNNNKKNMLFTNENNELDDKLDNIYESIQNIVFNKSKINKLNSNEIKNSIEPNKKFLQKEKMDYKNNNNNIKKEIFIKNKKDNNNLLNIKNNEKMKINNNSNFVKLKFENNFEKDNKNINDNLLLKENNFEDNFSFRNTFNINKNNTSKIVNQNNNKLITNDKIFQKEEKNNNQEIIDFCNIIKSNSPNIFKINSFEKKHSQKQILRLKLEAFLVIKKYYLHRKSKSAWIKKKKKLIKLSNNFYRNLLLSRSFYGFVLNSKRKSLYNLIKNNYIDFRIKELSSFLIKSLKFCYKEKNLENKAFFELTKNKLRRILKEMKAQAVYNKTIDKYFFSQILNNDVALEFSKILIYFGNSFNIKKLYRYESNINIIIQKEEFSLKQKLFSYLKNINNIVENKLNEDVETFKQNTIIFNDKKKFIIYLEEQIILSYKKKYFQQKLFFIRSKFYIFSKKKWKQKSPIFGPKKDLIKNFHNLKLKTISFKFIKNITQKRKQKIEQLQINNFMKNVKFFFYQSRRKTIEGLIIEGIKQKINKYNKFLVMKILFFSKIECLKQYRVMTTTRKKYQKKFLFNILKKNVLLKNYEKLCLKKYYFRLCFKLKIEQKKKERNNNKLYIIKGIQTYFIHLVKLRLSMKENLLKKKEKYKGKLIDIRKRYFIKDIKNAINKKKYDKLIYLKHDKIFSFAIGIINLKNKCKNGLKSRIKAYKLKKTKEYFNIFKKRIISNIKIRKSIATINKYILKKNYNKFIGINKSIISIKKKKKFLSIIHKKLYLKKYLESLNACYKMKLIDNKVDDYYITKRKKIFFNILKKRYQNSIKYSMLSLRFNEYLIISAFNSFFKAINKNKIDNNKIQFNNNDN